jgi:hypothetical protein
MVVADRNQAGMMRQGLIMEGDRYWFACVTVERWPQTTKERLLQAQERLLQALQSNISSGLTDLELLPNRHLFRALSSTELQEIRADRVTVLAFFSSKRLLRSLELDLRDLQNACQTWTEGFDGQLLMNQASMEEQAFHVHRLLLNLLSVFQSFLDHTTVRTKRRYGRRSAEAEYWRQAREPCSNQSFAYRVVRYLRDYAQHVDIPSIELNKSEDELIRLELNPQDFLDDLSQTREK